MSEYKLQARAYELRIMNSIRGAGKHITINAWTIFNSKIEAVCFVIKSNRKLN